MDVVLVVIAFLGEQNELEGKGASAPRGKLQVYLE